MNQGGPVASIASDASEQQLPPPGRHNAPNKTKKKIRIPKVGVAQPLNKPKNNDNVGEQNPTPPVKQAEQVEEEKHGEKGECITLYDPCTREELPKINPITNEEQYDVKLLEKRVRDIKFSRNTTPFSLYDLTNDTTNYEFLMRVFCDKTITLDDMVSFKLGEKSNPGSDIFEVLCRLFVIFGGVPDVNIMNGDFKLMTKIEDPSSIQRDLKTALHDMKCKATSKSGVSDITLVRVQSTVRKSEPDSPYCEVECDVKQPNEINTYLMSVKWYQKEKGGEHYDLEKLFIAGEEMVLHEKKPFSVIVFLRSKLDFEKAHRRSYRQYVSRIAQTFFGWNEDVKPFLEGIRKTLFQNADIRHIPPQELITLQYFTPSPKQILSLQLHQDLIVTGINDAIQQNQYQDNKYVIGVLPRGGKTFIAGGTIREFMNRNHVDANQHMHILWITAAPNETRDQVGKDLIMKYQDFDDFNFIDIKNITEVEPKQHKQHTLWFCSIQLLTAFKAGRARERSFLSRLLSGIDPHNKINMLFFDEAHAGGAGLENKKIIDELLKAYSVSIPFIFLSATYLSIAIEYNILKTNLFLWDYTDVLKTRALGTETERNNALLNLEMRFGKELVSRVVNRRLANTDSFIAMAKPYMDFPELYFVSCDFNKEAKERFEKQNMYNPNKGFSMRAIFGDRNDPSFHVKTVNNKIRKDAYRYFTNLEQPRNLISLFTPSDPTQTFSFDAPGGEPYHVENEHEQTLLKRIERISQQTLSRFRIDEYPTLLMFLPTGGYGSDITKLLPAFASLLMSHSWWNKRYEVACVVTDSDIIHSNEEYKEPYAEGAIPADNIRIIDKNVKSELLTYERELHCRPEDQRKGLIILAGDRLSMGISLPCTDCVFLLNETKSPDDIIQKMYRALTPSIGKMSSFVVDLNPLRSLSAVYGYTRAAYQSATTNSSILDIIYDVYSWDEDIINFQIEKGGSQRIHSSQERLKDMLEQASKDKEYATVFKDIGDLERKLALNIKKKVNEMKLLPLLKDIVINTAISSDGISYKNRANIGVKSGQLIIRLIKDRDEQVDEKVDNNGSDVIDDAVIIENFTETVTDFIKYLAITTKADTFDDAIHEFQSNNINNSGRSLQMDVIQLLKARGAIRNEIIIPVSGKKVKNPIPDGMFVQLLIDVIKLYSPDTSRDIYRQMRSKINEPTTRKNEVLTLIHRHLTPKKAQKETHGEVFTPIEVIEDMLSKLPKSIWSNPDLTFFDPANGIGNFPIIVFYKLNEGLKTVIKNEEQRKKHIIEKMLFMAEIQSNNTRIAKNVFSKLCKGCVPNIWTTDSLALTPEKLKKHGWPEKYDIIMGNPPFNAGGLLKGGGTLWPKFVYLAFGLIKPNGYITFVHPPGWRKFYDPEERDNQGKIWYTIKQNGWHLDYLHISDKPPQHFPIVDFYVIKAGKSNKNTAYDSQFMKIVNTGTTTLDNDFIPNMLNDPTQSIIDKLFKMDGEPVRIVYNQAFKPTKANEGKVGVSHYHFTDKQGAKKLYKKSYNVVPDYINKQKVLMTHKGGYEKGRLFAFYSKDAMGTTNNSMYMIVDSKIEGERAVEFFNSDIITFLLKITQYSASPNHINEFKILNQLRIPKSLEDYRLTKDEIALIKQVVGMKEGEVEHMKSNAPNKTRKNVKK